jgi:hypothetical protein
LPQNTSIAASEPPQKEVERLYGLPPDEFTAERDALAKRLRTEGSRDEADAVKGLKKPSLPAWTVNQLVRRHGKELRRLLEAGESLRRAHEDALSGGERGKLRKAADTEREIVAGLVERAEPLLSEAGRPSPANLERVRNTLHAVATDEELRAELEQGRVVKDRESVGLGPFAAAAAPAEGGGTATRRERERATSRRRELKQARSRAEQAARRLRSAEGALERARAEAEAAQRELKARQRSLDAARGEAEDAEEALRRAEGSGE